MAPGSSRLLMIRPSRCGMHIQELSASHYGDIPIGYTAVQLVLTAPGSFRPRRTTRSGYGTCIMVAVPLYYALVDFFFQRALSLQMENILLQGDQAAYISSTWFSRLL